MTWKLFEIWTFKDGSKSLDGRLLLDSVENSPDISGRQRWVPGKSVNGASKAPEEARLERTKRQI